MPTPADSQLAGTDIHAEVTLHCRSLLGNVPVQAMNGGAVTTLRRLAYTSYSYTLRDGRSLERI